MDNPQYYQPLSHALHPPQTSYSNSTNTNTAVYDKVPKVNSHGKEEEEEAASDDDNEEVEQQLHESNHSSPRPLTIDPSATTIQQPEKRPQVHSDNEHSPDPSQNRRRPGRPRGSKTRKPRILPPATTTGTSQSTQPKAQVPQQQDQSQSRQTQQQPPPQHQHQQQQQQQHQAQITQEAPTSTPQYQPAPPQLQNVNPGTQHYYEFQWRVLNLCVEFYGAAEELVKATPPLVIAQSYQMGPGVPVDPLSLLGEAKRHCDNLLNNPLSLISNPPPMVYPTLPPMVYQSYPTAFPPPLASASATTPVAASTASTSSAAVITNASSFSIPLAGASPSAQAPTGSTSAAHYPMYPTQPQYPYYYPSYTAAPSFYPAPNPTQQTHSTVTTPAAPVQSKELPPSISVTSAASANATTTTAPTTGTWSPEETTRLRQLYEKSRTPGTVPEGTADWDWVVQQWGTGRTRSQIFAKASNLGLRPSNARGTKRRRESAPGDEPDEPQSKSPPTPAAQTNGHAPSSSSAVVAPSPALSHATTTPVPSPLMHNVQRPSSTSSLALPSQSPSTNPQTLPLSKGKQIHASNSTSPILMLSKGPQSGSSGNGASSMPWPMPTVAVSTPSSSLATPGLASGGTSTDATHRTQAGANSYYRAADKDADSTKQATTHPYMYQPSPATGGRFVKHNGK